MGNEISTVSGGITTAGAAVLAGATLGQVKSLNDAVKTSASYTVECAQRTIVRHVGEATVMAAATATVGLANTMTFGQIQAVSNATASCASQTAQASSRAGTEFVNVADSMSDAIPGVGHVKGGICYALGANERGERALKSASRSIGVAGGAISGMIVGGPPGAIAGGIAGGAAMDAIITGADSAINGEYRPSGLIDNVGQIATASTNAARVEAIAGAISRIMVDSLAGATTGGAVDGMVGSDAPPTTVEVPGSDAAPGHDVNLAVDSTQPDVEPSEAETPPLFTANLARMTMKQYAALAATLYDKGVDKAIQVAAEMVIGTLVAMNAGDRPQGEAAGNDGGSAADAPAPNASEARTHPRQADVKRANDVGTLTHALVEMTAGFRNEIVRQRLSARRAATAGLENAAIVQLNVREAKQRLLETLSRTINESVKRGDPWHQLFADAMGKVGGVLGEKTAEAIRDVAASNHTKKMLKHMRAQFVEYVRRTCVPSTAIRGDQQPSNASSAATVAQQPAVPVASSELLFVLILIYVAASAFVMATRA